MNRLIAGYAELCGDDSPQQIALAAILAGLAEHADAAYHDVIAVATGLESSKG